MKPIKTVIDHGSKMTKQEMNVDSKIVETRGTHKVKRTEVIDGVEYYVFDVHPTEK
tara:strand:- start:457 stop:624 length:168 start_codon:yes stop_codon:yes gene_type:complete